MIKEIVTSSSYKNDHFFWPWLSPLSKCFLPQKYYIIKFTYLNYKLNTISHYVLQIYLRGYFFFPQNITIYKWMGAQGTAWSHSLCIFTWIRLLIIFKKILVTIPFPFSYFYCLPFSPFSLFPSRVFHFFVFPIFFFWYLYRISDHGTVKKYQEWDVNPSIATNSGFVADILKETFTKSHSWNISQCLWISWYGP